MAWWYREYAHEQGTQGRLAYRDEEENARAARRDELRLPQLAPTPPQDAKPPLEWITER
jgi:hypothetical protein